MKQLYTLVLATGLLAASSSISWSQTSTDQNTVLGYQAGSSSMSGQGNTLLGYQAGNKMATGANNVFIGNQVGGNNTTGGSNLFLGSYAGGSNTSGNLNLFMGNSSGQQTISGNGNTFIGDGSGYGNQTGGQNTYLGQYAGFYGNTAGTNDVFIGYLAGSGTTGSAPTVTNSVAIGANAIVTQSSSIVLGGTGASAIKVGIGTTAPANKLEITQGTSGNSGLCFTNLTKTFNPTATTNKFLTVDINGDVILANYGTPNFRVAADSLIAHWELVGQGTIQNTNPGGVIIGSSIQQAPVGYKLYVEQGILTEKVKVALKNTSEWSDHVFEPGYQLKGLSDVADFIQANKHLPGIPSALEMVEKGNDLHKTDAKLLEKIDELTLYLIQQKGKLETLRQQNQLIKEELKTLKKTNH